MNKMIKGSVAGAAGVALLMGSFGTYALWNDTAAMEGSKLTSGVMDIQAAAPVWDDLSTTDIPNDWNPGTEGALGDLLVPGDTVVRTQQFTVRGTGKNLEGTITLTGGAANTETGVTKTGDKGLLGVTVDVESNNVRVVQSTDDPNVFEFEAPFGAATLTAVVTYTLPASVSQTDAQGATATMAASTLTIQQTR